MTKKHVFMTKEEIIGAVNETTGENISKLGFSEEWEMDTVSIPVSTTTEKMKTFLASLTDKEHIQQTETSVVLPVISFIPSISALLEVSLENKVDVCECNLYEDEILYAFWIA